MTKDRAQPVKVDREVRERPSAAIKAIQQALIAEGRHSGHRHGAVIGTAVDDERHRLMLMLVLDDDGDDVWLTLDDTDLAVIGRYIEGVHPGQRSRVN